MNPLIRPSQEGAVCDVIDVYRDLSLFQKGKSGS